MLGLWPTCANTKEGCAWPGILKFEFTDGSGAQVAAFVCPLCVGKVPALLKEMAAVREEQRLVLDAPEDHGQEAKS